MSNKITATILFSFKGKRHTPRLELDLDQHMQASGRLPNLYPLIAKANGYDMYSYEYEMMQAEPISFIQPEGLVADFIEQDSLQIEAFEAAWQEANIQEELQRIASRHMSIDRLEEHPELQEALLAAYHAGKPK